MKAWGLYSARVDPYTPHELVELFARREDAEAARDTLIGLPINRDLRLSDHVWKDDEDFPDLYVRPLDIR